MSGSEADNIRRAIGRKQKDRLDKAMPSILDGYCSKSPKPRDVAEAEAKEFLQIIEDSANYQFGYNHSIAYCMLGYYCAYFRHYYPYEFLTAFLNNAANDDDIKNGTTYANKIGIKVTMPKYGSSKGTYFFDKDKGLISKGLSSVKFISDAVSDELYNISKYPSNKNFIDVLMNIKDTSANTRQIDALTKIDFFSEYGNQRELLAIEDLFYGLFKRGEVKSIKKDKVDGSRIGGIVSKHSIGDTKSGKNAKSYTVVDVYSMMVDTEKAILSSGMSDLDDRIKIENFHDIMGYYGYSSGVEADRRKLYVMDVYPLTRKRDGKQFGYSVITKSIGSGRESRFTVLNKIYNAVPIKKGDIILCTDFEREGAYFKLKGYEKM